MKITIYDVDGYNNYIAFSRCFGLISLNGTEPCTDLAFHHSGKAHSEVVYDFDALKDLDKVVGGKSYLMRYKYFV